MKLNKLITAKGILFLIIFSVLVFVGDRINFSKLVGSQSQFFTLFQFFGPVAGAFLGPVVGVLSVLIAEVASKISTHSVFDLVTILRLTPMLFAAWYFGTKKGKLSMIIPVIAIIAFVAHPVGRQVWYFSLFWIIPIILKYTNEKSSKYAVSGIVSIMGIILFWLSPAFRTLWFGLVFILAIALSYNFSSISSKSLGATFMAHAVGGAIWNYAVKMTPDAWNALIPIVIFERFLFASGIAASFVVLNTLLDKLDVKTKSEYINVDKKYALFRQSA